jgi:hypothetical protein
MTAAEYLLHVLNKYQVDNSSLYLIRGQIEPVLKNWAAQYFLELKDSGSMAKGTGINVNSDYDFLVSLSNNLNWDLKDIYENLHKYLKANGYPKAKAQNVSINITCYGKSVDITPGRMQQGFYTTDHSLYLSRQDTWRKTNIDAHIELVRNSYRTNEIKLTKIWRHNHNLEFPSLLIEVMVIEALQGNHWSLEQNFLEILRFFRDNIHARSFFDPGNTNNNLTDLLSYNDKQMIKRTAELSLKATNWNRIVW